MADEEIQVQKEVAEQVEQPIETEATGKVIDEAN